MGSEESSEASQVGIGEDVTLKRITAERDLYRDRWIKLVGQYEKTASEYMVLSTKYSTLLDVMTDVEVALKSSTHALGVKLAQDVMKLWRSKYILVSTPPMSEAGK